MPHVVNLGGREATPTPPERCSCSAARSHPAGVAGVNRNRWPECSGRARALSTRALHLVSCSQCDDLDIRRFILVHLSPSHYTSCVRILIARALCSGLGGRFRPDNAHTGAPTRALSLMTRLRRLTRHGPNRHREIGSLRREARLYPWRHTSGASSQLNENW